MGALGRQSTRGCAPPNGLIHAANIPLTLICPFSSYLYTCMQSICFTCCASAAAAAAAVKKCYPAEFHAISYN